VVVARRDAYFGALDVNRSDDLEPTAVLFALASFAAPGESRATATWMRDLPEQWIADLGRATRLSHHGRS
jgi:hypothetical protein